MNDEAGGMGGEHGKPAGPDLQRGIPLSGSIEEGDDTLAFRMDGHTLAVASVERGHDNVRAGGALERRDERALEMLVPGPRGLA